MYKLDAGHCGVLPSVAREPSRYAISGVALERTKHGGCAVATNGRILVAVECDAEPDAHNVIVPAKEFAAVKKAKRGKHVAEAVVTNGTPGQLKITVGPESVETSDLGDSFPPWRDIVPEPGAPTSLGREYALVHVNAKLLADALAAVPKGAEYTTVTLAVEFVKGGYSKTPIVLFANGYGGEKPRAMIGAVMPVAPPDDPTYTRRAFSAFER